MTTETIITPRGTLVRLAANFGMVLTDAGQTFFSYAIFLGVHDSPENYREIPELETEQGEAEK
jgi:hypothetical protein